MSLRTCCSFTYVILWFFSYSEIIRDFEDKTVIRTLTVAKATPEDLKRNYTCYARNAKGEDHSQAVVRMKGKTLAEHECEVKHTPREQSVLP